MSSTSRITHQMSNGVNHLQARLTGRGKLTPHLASIVGRDLAKLRFAVDDPTEPREAILQAWATALAIAWLIEHAIDVVAEGASISFVPGRHDRP
jgi:hypothetical protein